MLAWSKSPDGGGGGGFNPPGPRHNLQLTITVHNTAVQHTHTHTHTGVVSLLTLSSLFFLSFSMCLDMSPHQTHLGRR